MNETSPPAAVEYCKFCRHTTYLPCQDTEKAERCQLAGQAALDHDRADAACRTFFDKWWEYDSSVRRERRGRMISVLAAAEAIEARNIKDG